MIIVYRYVINGFCNSACLCHVTSCYVMVIIYIYMRTHPFSVSPVLSSVIYLVKYLCYSARAVACYKDSGHTGVFSCAIIHHLLMSFFFL